MNGLVINNSLCFPCRIYFVKVLIPPQGVFRTLRGINPVGILKSSLSGLINESSIGRFKFYEIHGNNSDLQ